MTSSYPNIDSEDAQMHIPTEERESRLKEVRAGFAETERQLELDDMDEDENIKL